MAALGFCYEGIFEFLLKTQRKGKKKTKSHKNAEYLR